MAAARFGLRARRRRSLLTALGIGLASAMLAAAVVVSDGLGRGFDRAARAADLPDVIVRFNPQQAGQVAQRIQALPDVAAFSLRQEFTGVDVSANGHSSSSGVGRGCRRRPPGLRDRRRPQRLGPRPARSSSSAASPPRGACGSEARWRSAGSDHSAWSASPRVRTTSPTRSRHRASTCRAPDSSERLGSRLDPRVNFAQIWLRDPRNVNEVLVQARATSYGLDGVRFVTRSGLRVLLDQAAGIVIDLLVALSVIALATAGVMLASSARAEVQRRLRAIGVRRAVGASRAHLALTQAIEALFVAVPAATIGARRRNACDLSADDQAADAAQRAGAGHSAAARPRRGVAGEHRHTRARRGVAGVARGGTAPGVAAARRRVTPPGAIRQRPGAIRRGRARSRAPGGHRPAPAFRSSARAWSAPAERG